MIVASAEAMTARSASLSGVTDGKISGMKVLGILIVVLLGSSLSAALTSTTTTLSSSLNPSTYGQTVTFTAVVSSTAGAPPNGETVTFLQGTNVLGTGALAGGSATFTISTLSTGGTDKITAKYPGDSTFAASTSAVLAQVVNDAATTTSLTSSQNPSNSGQSVTFTATVSVTPPGAGTPTGNVIFYNGSNRLGGVSLSASGVASFTTKSLANGAHSITATYNGSSSFNGSTSNTVNQVVGSGQSGTATTTTLSSSLNPSTYGQPVTFTAKVSSNAGAPPNGETVTFLQGTNVLGTGTLAGGTATFTISTLATGGTDKITAKYPGDSTFAASTSAVLAQVVNDAATTTSLTSSQNPSNSGQSVTFTATVSVTPPGAGTPTGNVIFYNGSNRLGGVSLSASGVASFTTKSLANGAHSITATYNGSSSFNGSTSNTVNQVVGSGQSGTATTTTLSSSLNPSTYGQPVTFTAKVSSNAGAPPNGETVTFLQGTNVLGTGTLAGGTATFTISTLATGGTDKITAKYPGDSNFAASTSAVLAQVVNDASTTTSLISSQNPSNSGQSVTFTATVSAVPPGGGTPTGNVIFFNGSKRLGGVSLAGGVASLTTASLGVPGTDSIT